jgi:plasmid stabilization system protein ParE
MSGYILGRDADQDLEELWNRVSGDSVPAADRLIRILFRAFLELAKFPGMGHKRGDLTPLPVRFWPVGNYLIVYRSERRPIEVVAIVHGNRDVPAFLQHRQPRQ